MMFKNIKNLFLLSIASLLGLLFMAAPLAYAAASDSPITGTEDTDIKKNLCTGTDLSFKGKPDCEDGGKDPREKTNKLIANIVNVISVVVGIIAVIMIIIGGLRFVTSGGDSGRVASARSTIIYAIIGLIIVALAQFVVKFVLAKATGVDDKNATLQ